MRIVPSFLTAYSWPCGSNATWVRDATPRGISESPNGTGWARSLMFHSRMLPLSLPDASVFPSGLKVTALMRPVNQVRGSESRCGRLSLVTVRPSRLNAMTLAYFAVLSSVPS